VVDIFRVVNNVIAIVNVHGDLTAIRNSIILDPAPTTFALHTIVATAGAFYCAFAGTAYSAIVVRGILFKAIGMGDSLEQPNHHECIFSRSVKTAPIFDPAKKS